MDMLALAAFGYEGDILGVPGTSGWEIEWFVKLAKARGTKRFDTFFDNDIDNPKTNPGQNAARSLGACLSLMASVGTTSSHLVVTSMTYGCSAFAAPNNPALWAGFLP
jgi:hypothetical protein